MISYGLSEGKVNEKGLQIDAQVKQEQVCIASIWSDAMHRPHWIIFFDIQS